MKKNPAVTAVFGIVFWMLFVTSSSLGGTLETTKYYTWGIDNSELDIPAGSIITEAELVFHDVYNLGSEIINSLAVHLIDNPPVGPVGNDDTGSGDIFETEGVSIKLAGEQQGYDLVYSFSANNDDQSWVWDVYNSPFDFQLSDSSQITYSSSLLELIDFAGTGDGFGFGIDHDGAEDCMFDEVTLRITVKSYEGAAREQEYVFTPQWAPGGPPALQMSKSIYEAGEDIAVNYYNAEENYDVWIAVAEAGSADTQYMVFSRTDATADGRVLFEGLSSGGEYVIRMFFDDTFNKVAEVGFTVESDAVPTVTTDRSVYNTGENIVVNYANAKAQWATWIAIAKASSGLNSYLTWSRTDGTANGSVTFGGLTEPGNYIVRLFFNNTFDLAADVAFEVQDNSAGVPSVTTSKSVYTTGEEIVVNYANAKAQLATWIAIAESPSGLNSYLTWSRTDGTAAGSVTFGGLTDPGTYIVRLFFNNVYDLAADVEFEVESGQGQDTPMLSMGNTSILTGSSISVNYSNVEAGTYALIALAPAGSADTSIISLRQTNGLTEGTVIFSGLSMAGDYVARLFVGGLDNKASEVSFQVLEELDENASITTSKSIYTTGEDIAVHYSNAQANLATWISLAEASSPDNRYVTWARSNGTGTGSVTFSGLTLNGDYVVRLFYNNVYDKAAEYSFSVESSGPSISTSKSTYAVGEEVVVNFSEAKAELATWISIAVASSPDNSYLTWARSGGTASGSITFAGLSTPGNYTVRLFFNNVYDKAAEFDFTVQ